MPDEYGLLILEGWMEPSSEGRPRFAGTWRRLTHWEMCRMRHGWIPWEER